VGSKREKKCSCLFLLVEKKKKKDVETRAPRWGEGLSQREGPCLEKEVRDTSSGPSRKSMGGICHLGKQEERGAYFSEKKKRKTLDLEQSVP